MYPLAVIVNLIFPGIGLVLTGRRLSGMLFAVVFCLALDGMVMSPLVVAGNPAATFVQAFLGLAVVMWVWSLIRLGLRIRFLRSPAFMELKETMFWEGIEQYLKNQLRDAKDTFSRLVAMDSEDADAYLYLGLVYKNLDQRIRARASLRRCARFDYARKWRWEIQEQLRELEGEKS